MSVSSGFSFNAINKDPVSISEAVFVWGWVAPLWVSLLLNVIPGPNYVDREQFSWGPSVLLMCISAVLLIYCVTRWT